MIHYSLADVAKRTMTREEYHAARRLAYNMVNNLPSKNDIGYSLEESNNVRYYADQIHTVFHCAARSSEWAEFTRKNELVKRRLARYFTSKARIAAVP